MIQFKLNRSVKTTNMKVIVCSLIYFLYFLKITAEENDFEKAKIEYKKKTISELFDIGGKPNEPGFMGGMPWPVEELKNRNPKDVKSEAIKRFKIKPKQKYDQVFAVYCLVDIFGDDIEITKILHAAYPKVDPLAQYEILLYACKYKKELFKAYFVKKLEIIQNPFTKSEILAVLFINTFPDRKVLKSLKKIESSKLMKYYYLDGFPFSDFVYIAVRKPYEMIQEVINKIENEEITSEEKLLIKKTRELILKPYRTSFSINDFSLSEVIESLNSKYKLYSIPISIPSNLICKNLNLRKVSIHEVLASFGNANLFTIYEKDNGFKFSKSNMSNFYWAKNGLLTKLVICPVPDQFIVGGVWVLTGIPWLNFPTPKINNVFITMPNGNIIKCQNSNFFKIPFSKEEYLANGGYIKKISADLSFPIPKIIKRKSISFIDAQNYESKDFGKKLNISITMENESEYIVKVKTHQLNENVFLHTYYFCDFGSIIMLDKEGKQIQGEYLDVEDKKANFTMKMLVKPETFVWTVTTEVEVVKMPIFFKDIIIPENFWK